MTEHARFNEAQGRAGLGICESLLIALTELKVISDQDAPQTPERHKAAAAIVQRILDGKNGVRH
jgi:hypothetical protein